MTRSTRLMCGTALALLTHMGLADAQTITLGSTPTATPSGDTSATTVQVGPGSVAEPLKTRFTGFYDPADYGAICDGSNHPMSTAFTSAAGVAFPALTTAASIAAVNGDSWINDGTWGYHVAATVRGGAASGAVNLTIYPYPAGMAVGDTVTGVGIPSGATIASITQPSGSALGYITLDSAHALTSAMPDYWISATNSNYIEITGALTDAVAQKVQRDFVGIEAALKAATAAGGGTVRPHGHCIIADANVAHSDLGTLIMPAGNLSSNQVSLDSGGNNGGVQFDWQGDLGTDRIGLSNDVPWASPANLLGVYNASNYYYGLVRGITLNGPQPYATLGATPAVAMSGYRQGARRSLSYVYSNGFWNDYIWTGDHTDWDHVIGDRSTNAAIFFAPPNPTLAGDNYCVQCEFQGSVYGMLASYLTPIAGFHMKHGSIENNFAAIAGEATPADDSLVYSILSDASFDDLNMEWNKEFVLDLSAYTYVYSAGAISGQTFGTPRRGIVRTYWSDVYQSYTGYGGPSSGNISARPAAYEIVVNNLDGVSFLQYSDFTRGGANGDFGSAGLIYANSVGSQYGGLLIEGDITTLANEMEASGLPLINSGAANLQQNTTLRQLGTGLEAHLSYTAAGCGGEAPIKGALVESSADCNGNMAPFGHAAGDAFLGVAMTDTANIGNELVQTRGFAYGILTSSAVKSGQFLKGASTTTNSVTTPSVVPATSATDSVIAKSYGSAASGGSVSILLIPQE